MNNQDFTFVVAQAAIKTYRKEISMTTITNTPPKKLAPGDIQSVVKDAVNRAIASRNRNLDLLKPDQLMDITGGLMKSVIIYGGFSGSNKGGF